MLFSLREMLILLSSYYGPNLLLSWIDQEKALDFTQAFLHGRFDDIMPVTLRSHSSVPDTLPTPPITELYPTL